MKINFIKKFWIKLLNGIALTSTLIVPTVILASCSCSSTLTKPEPVKETPDTSSITTFAAAKSFTKQYLEENYNIDLLNNDAKYWTYDYITQVGKIFEFIGFKIVKNTLNFNIREENNKIFIDSEYKTHGEIENGYSKSETINSIQNVKVELIFVLRDNVVHVEFAISYTFGLPDTFGLVYDSLQELKDANPDWQKKIIFHTINISATSLGGSDDSLELNKWIIVNTQSGGDYILKPDPISGFVNFYLNWFTFKISSLLIIFNNIQDITDHLSPV